MDNMFLSAVFFMVDGVMYLYGFKTLPQGRKISDKVLFTGWLLSLPQQIKK